MDWETGRIVFLCLMATAIVGGYIAVGFMFFDREARRWFFGVPVAYAVIHLAIITPTIVILSVLSAGAFTACVVALALTHDRWRPTWDGVTKRGFRLIFPGRVAAAERRAREAKAEAIARTANEKALAQAQARAEAEEWHRERAEAARRSAAKRKEQVEAKDEADRKAAAKAKRREKAEAHRKAQAKAEAHAETLRKAQAEAPAQPTPIGGDDDIPIV